MSTVTVGSSLPHTVDVFKLAARGTDLSGQFSAKDLARLNEAVLTVRGGIDVEVQFFVGDEGFIEVTGAVLGQVGLSCQRCLGEVHHELRGKFALGVVREEAEIAALPRRLDPWLLEAESADLRSLVEDELLLNLPIVAMHSRVECEPIAGFSFDNETVEEEPAESPFQMLEQLKKEF